MIALDTNVLVRYIVKDDVAQLAAARALVLSYKGFPQSIYISQIVLCEMVWVLQTTYKFSQQQIALNA